MVRFRLCTVYCITFFAIPIHSECFFNGKIYQCSSNLEKIQLSEMSTLDLSFHNLTDLPVGVLSLYQHITHLNLTSNVLRRIDERRPLARLQYLEVIDLTNNSLIFMNLLIFAKNPALRVLILNDNPHMLLSPSAAKLANLEELHLENCGFDTLHSSTFQELTLKVLNLQWNQLLQLPGSLSGVNVILLKGNPMLETDRDKAGYAKDYYMFGWMSVYDDLFVVRVGFFFIAGFCYLMYYMWHA